MLRPSLLIYSLWLFAAAFHLAAAERPNILLILSDDHSVPHVGCYGDANCQRFAITPNLDAFAAGGMRFNRAYTAAPQCAPSRISIFTGRTPVALGVTRFAQPAKPEVPFFTDLLRSNGWWTGIDGRHQHLDGRVNDAPHIMETLKELGMRELDSRFDHFVRSASTKGANLAKVGEKVSAILDTVPAGKPFFLYFGFNQPHRSFGEDHEGIDPAQLVLPPDWPDLPEVRLDYARYLAEVRDLDTGFGLIDAMLTQRGIKENTLVIFMGDNGEALLRGKGTVFDRGTHVPLLIRWPAKIKPGTTCDALISGIDLAPTILDAVGLQPAHGMGGVSFLPALRGQPFEGQKQVFAERGWHFGPITRTDGFDLSRSIMTKRHRYIYNAIPDRSYTPVDMPGGEAWTAVQAAHKAGKLSKLHDRLYFQNPRPLVELYDLENDPFELRNLAGESPVRETEDRLRIEMEKWMIREGDFVPLPTHVLQKHR
jgi:N-sulfoglucosamine sulfohydrolase